MNFVFLFKFFFVFLVEMSFFNWFVDDMLWGWNDFKRRSVYFPFCNNGLALVVPEFLRYSMECMEHCDGLRPDFARMYLESHPSWICFLTSCQLFPFRSVEKSHAILI